MPETSPTPDGEDTGSSLAAPSGRSRLSWLLRWTPLVALVLGGLLISFFGFSEYLTLSVIIEGRSDLLAYVEESPLRAAGIYFGIYVLAVVFSAPGGSVLTIVGGIVFGGLLAGFITTLAASTGALFVFLVAKTALGDWLRRKVEAIGPRVAHFSEELRANAFYVIVVLRLIPVMPYWASNALPAMFGIGVWTFLTATAIGLLPWTVSFAFFGAALDEVLIAQERANPGCAAAGTCELDFSAMSSGPAITGILIALAALVPVVVHWWNRRKKKQTTQSRPTV